jgi:hypothetical protein
MDGIIDRYYVFDFPGQVELYTHDSTVKTIVDRLQKHNYRVSS